MAEELERTEKPTPKRREEARRKGQIAVSQEIFTLANLFAVSAVLLTLGGTAAHQGIQLFHRAWAPFEPFGPGLVAERLRHTSWCNEIFVPRGGSMNFGKSGPPSLCTRMPGRTS